jgi:hypothetical protein
MWMGKETPDRSLAWSLGTSKYHYLTILSDISYQVRHGFKWRETSLESHRWLLNIYYLYSTRTSN